MIRSLATLVLLAGLCVPRAGSQVPQAVPEIGAVRETGRPIERVRARLSARPKEERARLERNLAEFERLPPEARAKVLRRAGALRERERALEASAADEPAGRIERQSAEPGAPATIASPAERISELRRARLREQFRQHGREVRARIPPAVQRWLEKAPPELRRRYLELLNAERELLSLKALAELRDRLDLPPEEVQRLERLPLVERLRAMRALREGSERAGGGGSARARRQD